MNGHERSGDGRQEPSRIGPYRIESWLGAGGMGSVYAAYDERLARRVAVKHLRPDLVGAVHADLRREARAVAALNHPAIVQIFDVLETGGGEWIVMEWVDGPTVADLVAAGPLELSLAVDLACQVAGGLAEAHAKGLLHRDLKAENVMVAAGQRAKILDFGIAQPLRRDTGSTAGAGEIVGTCRAMSPEQARGRRLDQRSDLFSLGTLLYEMATGVSPFEAGSSAETLRRIAVAPHLPAGERRPEIPEELGELIDRLLEKPPEQRPRDAEEVAERLAAIAELLPAAPPAAGGGESRAVLARMETRFEAGDLSAARRVRLALARRRGPLILAAVMLLVVLGGIWTRGVDDSPPVAGAVQPGVVQPGSADRSWEEYRRGMALLERFDEPTNLEAALELFTALTARDPDYAPGQAGLALARWRKGEEQLDPSWWGPAREAAERAVELDRDLAVAHLGLGFAEMGLGNLDEAASAFETVLLLAPDHAEAHRGLGEVQQRRGDFDQVLVHYRRAVELAPENRRYRDLLGILHLGQGRLDEAAAEFERSIELAPQVVFGYQNLSTVYARQGRLGEAAALLQQALEIRPNAALYSNLGTLLFMQGHPERAIVPFRKALEFEEGAGKAVFWANLGDACRLVPGHEAETRDAYARAIELSRQTLAARPDAAAAVQSRIALYQARRGACAAAVEELRDLAVPDSQRGPYFLRVALVGELCGDRERALAALGRALEAGLQLSSVTSEPDFDDLRASPAFAVLVEGRGTGSGTS